MIDRILNRLNYYFRILPTHYMTPRRFMNIMQKEGVTTIVEIGPGNVLSGLAKRSMNGILASQISNSNDLGY